MTADKLIIRTSDRATFRRCRQLWDFTSKIRQDWEPLRPKDYLEFGTAWHAAMEVWYSPDEDMWGKWQSPEREAGAGGAFAGTNFAQKQQLERLGFGGPDLDKEFDDRAKLSVAMLLYYFGWSRANDDLEPITVEHEFEVPIIASNGYPLVWCIKHNRLDAHDIEFLDDKPIVYQGRIDGLVRDLRGHYYVLEHKTSAKESSTNWLAMDDQTGSYCWALQKMLGVPIMGVIHTRAYKRAPQAPKVLKDGSISVDKRQYTTAKQFLDAVQKAYPFQDAKRTIADNPKYTEYMKFLQSDAAPVFVERFTLERSSEMIEDIGRRIALEAQDMLSDPAIYPNVSPMNCNGCAFYAPCLAKQDGSDWEFMLKSSYRKRGE